MQKLVYETAKIEWRALQRFYAQGKVMQVASELDLVKVATAFSEDDIKQVDTWTKAGQVQAVEDTQALDWFESDALVWAVTVAPFVLVQSIITSKH